MKETIRELERIAADHEKKAAGLRKHIEGLNELVNGDQPKKKTRKPRRKKLELIPEEEL